MFQCFYNILVKNRLYDDSRFTFREAYGTYAQQRTPSGNAYSGREVNVSDEINDRVENNSTPYFADIKKYSNLFFQAQNIAIGLIDQVGDSFEERLKFLSGNIAGKVLDYSALYSCTFPKIDQTLAEFVAKREQYEALEKDPEFPNYDQYSKFYKNLPDDE